jgi:hypothetical protein
LIDNWHGWPPQAWDGGKWVEVEPAALAVEQAKIILEQQHEIERLAWLADLRSGADGP